MSDYSSLYLDGNTDIEIGTTTEFGLVNKSFTVEVWVKIETHQTANPFQDAAILGSRTTNEGRSKQLHLVIRKKKPYFGTFGSDTPGKTELLEKVWYHLAFCYDASRMEQRIFVNGVLDAVGTQKPPFQGEGSLKISHWGLYWKEGQSPHFHGYIRELRIWDSALNQQGIAENMYRDLISAKGLTAIWKFNGTSIIKSLSQPDKAAYQEQILRASSQLSFQEKSAVVSFKNNEGIIRLSEKANLDISTSLTVEAWVNPAGTANSNLADSPILVASGDTLEFQLLCNREKVGFSVNDSKSQPGKSAPQMVSFNYPILPDHWYHIVGYFDKTRSEIGVLINGIAKATQRVAIGDFPSDKVKELTIGGSPFFKNSRFNGLVAEVRWWGIVRSTEEIQRNMYQEIKEFENLKAYWKLDETYGQKAVDSTGNGNDVSLENVVRVESNIPIADRNLFKTDDLLSGIKNAWKQAQEKAVKESEENERIKKLEQQLSELTAVKNDLSSSLSDLEKKFREKESELSEKQKEIDSLHDEKAVLADDSEQITITSFINKTKEAISKARTETADSGYNLGNVNLQFKVIPTGTGGLISFPKPDELLGSSGQLSTIEIEFEAKEEAKEKVVVEPAEVPDVEGMTEIMARRKLTQAGFVTEVKFQATGNAIKVDRVIKQQPIKSEKVEPGTKVTIFIGKEISK